MHALFDTLQAVFRGLGRRSGRAIKRVGCGCLLAILLILAVLVAMTAMFIAAVNAAPLRQPTFAVYVLLDESNSNTDLGGVGSDPDGLRHEAARLLLTYLFVDGAFGSPGGPHLAALIHFGTAPQLTAPLAPLDTAGRTALLEKLAPAEPFGWTDHLAGLTLALDDATTHADGREPVVVMFTDGKSDWDDSAAIDRDAYLADLRAQGQHLADMGGRLFIVLLQSEATDADPEIASVWKPLWREMATATGLNGGGFYEVRRPEDLPGVYHDIAADLTGHVVAPPVVDATAAATPTSHTVEVEPGLAGLTLVIAKSDPETVAQVFLPNGQPLTDAVAGVRHAGGDGALEEVWQVEAPPPGRWTVLLSGQGRVLVWKDVRAAAPTVTAVPTVATPAPTASAVPPAATAALLAVATSVPATPLPVPTLVAPSVAPVEAASPARWLWLVLPVATGAGLLWRQRRRQPAVTGALRVLGAGAEQVIDLDAHRRRVTIGAAPADIVLPIPARFTLVPRRVQGAVEIVLGGDADALGQIFVNNHAPVAGQPLRDMDVIRCGDLRLRYENLALRPAEVWPDPADDLEQLTY